jgi:hypothetical protein
MMLLVHLKLFIISGSQELQPLLLMKEKLSAPLVLPDTLKSHAAVAFPTLRHSMPAR